jgi:NADH-quinone oxidoreductase subunit D
MAINAELSHQQGAEQAELRINMGPQHPATHGVFRMVLTLDGEKVIGVEPHIGYLHRGSEKLSEGENFQQIITLFDRLDYIANFNNEWVYVRAVEKALGVEVPPRAEHIRVILGELNRIASHFLFYGTYGLDTGAMNPVMIGFRERERIQAVFEAVSGARMMHNYFRIGGVKEDVPEGFVPAVRQLLDYLKRGYDEARNTLTESEIFIERTAGVGALSAEDAVDYGVSGPLLRASGVAYDVRRAEPYSIYPELDFSIPVGKHGDCYDRYMVRMLEIEQSIKIVEQALERMPEGLIQGRVPRIIRPAKGDVYVRGENPRGDLGVYLVSSGGTVTPWRLKIRGPSFCNLMALEAMMVDSYLADATVILGSTDIVLGEVDR